MDYQNIINNSTFGFALHKMIFNSKNEPVDYEFLEVNPAFEKLTGLKRENIINKKVTEVIPGIKSDPFDWISYYGDAVLKNENREIEQYSQALKKWYKVQTSICDKDCFYIMFFDITALKQAQAEQELYFTSIQTIGQPLVITDTDGNILRVNDAFLQMYGFELNEVIGENPRVLNPGKEVYINFGYTDKEYDRLFKEMWNSILDQDIGTWEGVVVNRKKDGTLIWVKLLINTIFNRKNKPKNFIAMPIDISGSMQKESNSRIQLYQTIASLAELRDNETGNHMRRVGIYAKFLAREFGMPERYCNDIEIFAPLHDIGKVGIQDSLLLAKRALTPEEYEIMKTHTILGYNIVKGNKELDMVAAITLNHHEYYNGSGYPNGLEGEGIPLSAMISAIADVYAELRSKRPYKAEWSHDKAVETIANSSGQQFDPALIEIFMNIKSKFNNIYDELKD